MRAWLPASDAEFPRLLDLIRDLVRCESPSRDRAALDECAAILVDHLTQAGAAVKRHPGAPTADHVVATWSGEGSRVLLVGHFDTVWPRGQIARQPCEVRDDRVWGPGVFDMKAGLAIAVTAARLVTSTLPASKRPALTFLATSDEEVGSGTSRSLIEGLARASDAVLVLEPALAGGAVKTSRKGVGEFEIRATGIAAHAGVDPGAGASAVHEIAWQIAHVNQLAEPARGLSINVGVVEGGTRSNVVAEFARAVVDVRVAHKDDADRIERAMRDIRPHDPRVTVEVTGGVNRPPMERGPGVVRLFRLAREVAHEQGWELAEGGTGGASDGNFSAALGVPTLDGLGAVGDGAHAIHEHVTIKDLVPRTALLAGLLARLGDNTWKESVQT